LTLRAALSRGLPLADESLGSRQLPPAESCSRCFPLLCLHFRQAAQAAEMDLRDGTALIASISNHPIAWRDICHEVALTSAV
jgi:hypothetical protein